MKPLEGDIMVFNAQKMKPSLRKLYLPRTKVTGDLQNIAPGSGDQQTSGNQWFKLLSNLGFQFGLLLLKLLI